MNSNQVGGRCDCGRGGSRRDARRHRFGRSCHGRAHEAPRARPGGLRRTAILCVAASPSGIALGGHGRQGHSRDSSPDGTLPADAHVLRRSPRATVCRTLYVHGDSIWAGHERRRGALHREPDLRARWRSAAPIPQREHRARSGRGQRVRGFNWLATTSVVRELPGRSVFAGGSWINRSTTLSVSVRALAVHIRTPFGRGNNGRPGGATMAARSRWSPWGTWGPASPCSRPGAFSTRVPRARAAIATPAPPGRRSPTPANFPSTSARSRPALDGRLWVGTPTAAPRADEGVRELDPPRLRGARRRTDRNGRSRTSRGVWIGTGNFTPPGQAFGRVLHEDGVKWSAILAFQPELAPAEQRVLRRSPTARRSLSVLQRRLLQRLRSKTSTERWILRRSVGHARRHERLRSPRRRAGWSLRSVEFGNGVYVWDGPRPRPGLAHAAQHPGPPRARGSPAITCAGSRSTRRVAVGSPSRRMDSTSGTETEPSTITPTTCGVISPPGFQPPDNRRRHDRANSVGRDGLRPGPHSKRRD